MSNHYKSFEKQPGSNILRSSIDFHLYFHPFFKAFFLHVEINSNFTKKN